MKRTNEAATNGQASPELVRRGLQAYVDALARRVDHDAARPARSAPALVVGRASVSDRSSRIGSENYIG